MLLVAQQCSLASSGSRRRTPQRNSSWRNPKVRLGTSPVLHYTVACVGPPSVSWGNCELKASGHRLHLGHSGHLNFPLPKLPKFINLPNMNWIHTHQSWESPPSIAQQKLLLIVLGQCSDSAKLANSYWKCKVTRVQGGGRHVLLCSNWRQCSAFGQIPQTNILVRTHTHWTVENLSDVSCYLCIISLHHVAFHCTSGSI